MEKLVTAATMNSTTSTSQSSTTATKSLTGDRQVRILKWSEYKQAAACLADAFQEDEVAGYPVHTPDREHWNADQKWKMHYHIMECLAKAHILRGMVTCIGPNYDCVALWYVSYLLFLLYKKSIWNLLI